MLFLPFFGTCLGVLGRTWDFFPITKVSGEAACPVEGANAAAFVLGVLGYACKRDNEEYLKIKNVVNGEQGTKIPLVRS